MVEREEQWFSESNDGGGIYGGAGRVEAALLCVSIATLSVMSDALLRYSLLREYLWGNMLYVTELDRAMMLTSLNA